MRQDQEWRGRRPLADATNRSIPMGAPNNRAATAWPGLETHYRVGSAILAGSAILVIAHGLFEYGASFKGLAFYIAGVGVGSLAGLWRRSGYKRLFQRRAEYASCILASREELNKVTARFPVFLLSRAFEGDLARVMEDAAVRQPHPLSLRYYLDSRACLVETKITQTLQLWGPFIAVGRPVDSSPYLDVFKYKDLPGYATVPHDVWFERFTDLAEIAAGIVIFPSATPSCLRELRWIIDRGLLDKCVFVMTPEVLSPRAQRNSRAVKFIFERFSSPDLIQRMNAHVSQQNRLWSLAAMEFELLGITLPLYQPDGRLFAYSRLKTLKLINMFEDLRIAVFRIPPRAFQMRLTFKTLLFGRIPNSPPNVWVAGGE